MTILTMCGEVHNESEIILFRVFVVELKVKHLNQLFLQIIKTAVAQSTIIINNVVDKAGMSAINAFTA